MDPANVLSSWHGDDCCNWRGVGCDARTGHVVLLDLGPSMYHGDSLPFLSGDIDPSLANLTHLSHLDLSFNSVNLERFLPSIGSLTQLVYLNLSDTHSSPFKLPPQLGNLSSLRYLDLSSTEDLEIDNLQWLSGLSSLQLLDLSDISLDKVADWLPCINMVPTLAVLRLASCYLPTITTSISHINLTSLAILDLSGNDLNSSLPDWLFNMTSLEFLDLHTNSFHGRIPASLGAMTSLETLYMDDNELQGEIPAALGNICNLRTLDLSVNNITGGINELLEGWSRCGTVGLEELNLKYNNLGGGLPPRIAQLTGLRKFSLAHNRMSGTIPKEIGQLSRLESLDLSFNAFNGVVFEAHFVHLGRLKALSLTSNSLVLNLSSLWIPPFQLKILGLGSCQLGPDIPPWLRTQKNLSEMGLSRTGIVGRVPSWFLNLASNISLLDLSNNIITGRLPKFFKFSNAYMVSLSSNQFEGQLPSFSAKMKYLDLSYNLFSGTIPSSFMETMPQLTSLLLSGNLLHGDIPSVCNFTTLGVLDLSNNIFTGGLPTCQGERSLAQLATLNLANNNLSGKIPDSIGHLQSLETLHLDHNNLSGEIPLALRRCKFLILIDLGENRLSGHIPAWIGDDLSSLMFLRLHSNLFSGHIPLQLMHLSSLQILDIAHNDLSGPIPQSVGNLSAMITKQEPTINVLESTLSVVYTVAGDYDIFSHKESLLLDVKGRDLQYEKILTLVASIDFSDNKFSGEIPAGLTDLVQLQSLNLSDNQFTGKIPEKIGNLKSLESLDLSENRLSGTIPSGMSALSSLSYLNLSSNNLSGRIPLGNQLQTLDDPTIYLGNNDLCGFPLEKKCPGEETSQAPISTGGNDNGDDNIIEILWFYAGASLGLVVGIWMVFGILIFKKNWRFAYFRHVDQVYDKFYVAVALMFIRLKMKMS
ncbi:receptor-like protein EIX1 [Cocos nucifera]|uniref:Receptor-like protein EIX1 n=1 Tax=Cocos nucifera TaxID=13894 RepID=A0A8K0ILM9_COCNU|nr:receptor-like protein EIX1 [Cocos nucifera]